MRRVAVVVFVGVALTGAGCNLVFGLEPGTGGDDDGLDGGADGDGAPDDAEIDAPPRRFDLVVAVAVGASPSGLAVGELGGANGAHIAVADSAASTVSIVTCGAARKCERRGLNVGLTPTAVVMFDANGDTRLDLATACYNVNRVELLIGDGNGGFSPGQAVAYALPLQLFAGRFAGDTNVDLLVGGASPMSLQAFTGNGAGVFTAAGTTTTTTPIRRLTAGQLLDGGTTEVVTSDDTIVRMRQPDGTGALFVYGAAIPGPVEALLTADLDGDVHGDLVVGYPSGDVTIYYGDGLGAYTSVGGQIAVPPGYVGLAAGDLDGDGASDDLAVATHTLDESVREVHLFHGDGSRSFAPGPVILPGAGPREIAIADVDADGKNDVVMTLTAANQVAIAFAD